MMSRILVLITMLFFSLHSHAQYEVAYDTSTVEVRMFSKAKINEYKHDRDFQYDLVAEPTTSLWDRFWSWFWHKVNDLLSTRSGKRTFTVVMILLAVGVLVFAIMKLTGMNSAGLFGTRNTGEGLPYSTSDEDIHAISFEEAIEKAVNEGNLRLAVRLLYLQSLKKLSDRELIHWQIDKTNIAYVHELEGTAYEQSFGQLTSDFERNWYGDRHIEPAEFNQLRDQFNLFNQQLR
jgi:hypothetical protein